jgi:hypothetical protein
VIFNELKKKEERRKRKRERYKYRKKNGEFTSLSSLMGNYIVISAL